MRSSSTTAATHHYSYNMKRKEILLSNEDVSQDILITCNIYLWCHPTWMNNKWMKMEKFQTDEMDEEVKQSNQEKKKSVFY